MQHRRAAVLLIVPVLGLLALVVFEMLRGFAEGSFDAAALPPVGLLVAIVSLSALPVILLSLFESRSVLWCSLAIAGLLSLFHGLHAVEHLTASDFELLALIAVTMLTPSLSAAV
ncbi:MAG: hypothetical protein AAF690_25340, partial [Acidobacteriota bacterium]